MKVQLLVLCATASMVALSCSKAKDATAPDAAQGTQYVSAYSSVDNPLSKAPVDNTAVLSGIIFYFHESAVGGITDPASPDLPDYADNNGSGPVSVASREAGTGVDQGGKITFASPFPYNKTTNDFVYATAFYTNGTTDLSDSGANVFGIDGSQDVLHTELWDAGNMSSPNTTGLTFKHALANIKVVCKGKAGEAIAPIRTAWGNIESITLVGTNTRIRFNRPCLGADPTFEIPKDLPLRGKDYAAFPTAGVEIPASDAADALVAAAMVAPTESSALKFKVKGKNTAEVEVDVTLSGNLEVGKTHTVTFSFGAKDLKVEVTSSTITAWDPNGNTGDSTIENP